MAAGFGAAAGRFGRGLLSALRRGVRARRGWCEGAVAALWAVVALRVWTGALDPAWAVVPLLLGWWAVLLAVCDLRAARLPDALTLPAYPVAAVVLAAVAWWSGSSPGLLAGAVAGAVLFAGCYALVRLAAPAALGAGDVKLAGGLGAAVGAVSLSAVPLCAVAAAVLTMIISGFARDGPVPHGPSMLLPAWLVTALLPGAHR